MFTEFEDILMTPLEYIELCIKYKDIISFDYSFNLKKFTFYKRVKWTNNYRFYDNTYLTSITGLKKGLDYTTEFLAINIIKDRRYFTYAQYGIQNNGKVKFTGKYEWKNVRPTFESYLETYLTLTKVKKKDYLKKIYEELFNLMINYNNLEKYEEEQIISKFMYKNKMLNHE